MRYVALLRGINVGGKSLIKMADLKLCFESESFENVSTYIQSGNVFFSANEKDELKLAKRIEKAIEKTFKLPVRVVVISNVHMKRIIAAMPKDWGNNPEWKYNTLFLLPPYDMDEVVAALGVLKPDIEMIARAEGAIFQAVELKSFGRSTTGKLAASPIYKQITIRNNNTTLKLLEKLATDKV